jgi:predicted double-glycine peptidase
MFKALTNEKLLEEPDDQTRGGLIYLKIVAGTIIHPKSWGIFMLAMILFLAPSACLRPNRLQTTPEPPSALKVANLIRLPMTHQANDYSCGVAALQSILYYYGKSFRHDELVKVLQPDPVNGTRFQNIAEFARLLGFQVDPRTDMSIEELKKLIDDREPVIVLIQAWPDSPVRWSETWEEGHYAVVIGYDGEHIYFMDPSTIGHYTFIPIPEFLDRWHDMDGKEKLIHFGMVITKQGSAVYNPDIVNRLN